MINSVEITCRPESNCLIPHSTGHLLYSAVLKSIDQTNPELSQDIHSTDQAQVHVTPLNGEFDPKDSNRKRVFEDSDYNFFINLIDTQGFQELFNDLVLSGRDIQLAGEEFQVQAMETEEIEWRDLMEKKTPQNIKLHFMSPTSIQYKSSGITEMFPHREAVFKALEDSWNRNAPNQMSMNIDREDLKQKVTETPERDANGEPKYRTHSTVVTRKQQGQNRRQIKAFGFTGTVNYGFKDADNKLAKKLGILARYAKYAGLGSHTARGLGNTYTEVRH